MKNKELSEETLIALARLAPKVEPRPEAYSKKATRTPNDPRVAEFISLFNIKAGKNDISVEVLLEAFESHIQEETNETVFYKAIDKIFKPSSKGRVKLNMKPITILELVRESKEDEQKEE